MKPRRLDEWLVEQNHYPTRAKARDAILRGNVTLAGEVSPKPSRKITDPNLVKIKDPAQHYVSRAALKLLSALEITGLSPSGKTCLDLGASTGGFSQVLLERGATHVYGVDVGYEQIATKVLNHPNFTNLEKLNCRDLTLEHLNGYAPEFITSDVSFISLKLALPPALEIAAPGCIGVFLVKPQFEVGKNNLGKGGIVRTDGLSQQTANDLKQWLDHVDGWRATDLLASPIKGGDGNAEYLLIGKKHG